MKILSSVRKFQIWPKIIVGSVLTVLAVLAYWQPITALAAIVILVLSGLRVIPEAHYGVRVQLGRRLGSTLYEGTQWVIPFIDKIVLFSKELVTVPVDAMVMSLDKLQIIIRGKAQIRPDVDLLSSRFFEISETTIREGIVDAIKSELGIIAGTKNGEAFINKREAITQLINCVLRMKNSPHVRLNLKPNRRLDHYRKNSAEIRCALADEQNNTGDRSDIEERYGIDIVIFELADVDFSEATKKQFELLTQTEAKLSADEAELDKKLGMIEKFKAAGLSSKDALLASEVTIDDSKRQIHTIDSGSDKLPRPLIVLNK